MVSTYEESSLIIMNRRMKKKHNICNQYIYDICVIIAKQNHPITIRRDIGLPGVYKYTFNMLHGKHKSPYNDHIRLRRTPRTKYIKPFVLQVPVYEHYPYLKRFKDE